MVAVSDAALEEQRMEGAVISELRRQPLYAVELVTALRENREAVVAAVLRLQADGQICTPKLGARYELA
jgi:hypothetical protein